MTLPNNITEAVLAYHAAHLAKEALYLEYGRAARSGSDEIESIGRKCDAAFDARQLAQVALLIAIERMEAK